jgi:hypothetical protein
VNPPEEPRPKKPPIWLRGEGSTGDEWRTSEEAAARRAAWYCEAPLQQKCLNGVLSFPDLPYMVAGTRDDNFYIGVPFCARKGNEFSCSVSCATVCTPY